MTETPTQEQTYEVAAARVEEIIRRLDSGQASLGETLELVKEGKALIEYCAGELEAVGGALEELRLDELVGRLEGEAAGERVAGSASPEDKPSQTANSAQTVDTPQAAHTPQAEDSSQAADSSAHGGAGS